MSTRHVSDWTFRRGGTTSASATLVRASQSRTRGTLTHLAAALLLALLPAALTAGSDTSPTEEETLFDLSIEQLMEEEIPSTASLTETSVRMTPAAMTTITAEQIQASGARSLFELLDIYVPNLQWSRNHWEADNLGLRGIMNDRDDKYLLLVNGRVMNERTHYGVLSERDLVMLRDIHHIDVVRGPGSALYGPGAIAMVINIITHSGETFQGTEVAGRLGAAEEFYSGEFKHGRKFDDDDGSLFLYAGAAKYLGADEHDAPQIYGFDFPDGPYYDWDTVEEMPSDGTEAGEPILNPVPNNDGATHRNLPPLKLYAEITKGPWDIWARYTRGGKQFVWATGSIVRTPWGWGNWMTQPQPPNSYGYQQATGYVGYKKDLSEQTALDAAFSYDLFDFERYAQAGVVDTFREDEYYGKAMLRHNIGQRHKVAGGFEISHEEFGFASPGWPHLDEPSSARLMPMPRWSTNLYSALGEYQWTINDQWTTFVGVRLDDHTYTSTMFSPRLAAVFTPNPKDTYKLLWAKSVRANYAEEMKLTDMETGQDSRTEKLSNLELRYERTHNERLNLAASAFVHYDLERITWSSDANGPIVVGRQREWGIELEALYHTERTRVGISHGFTKLIDFDLADPNNLYVGVTAEPYGYGDDLARWSNHITKITAQHKFNDEWTADGSLRIYWGFPGMKDYDQYLASLNEFPDSEPGWERAYRGNYYLNLGLQYQPRKNLTVRLDGFNLLGLIDKDLNKRNYGAPDYRSHAAAVAASLIYRF